MTHFLIIESNTPDHVARIEAQGRPSAAGYYAAALRSVDEACAISIANPYAGEQARLDGVDGVIFTGSAVSWSVDDLRAKPLIDAAEPIFASGLPLMGSCNGLHLGALMLGGAVGESPNGKEIGLARNIQLTQAGLDAPLMAGRQSGFAAPCVHRDEVTVLPKGAELLASNAHSKVQAMRYLGSGVDYFGVQYHPEYPTLALAGFVTDDDSIFNDGHALADDLAIAERDADAATRLGGTLTELTEAARITEIRNWMGYVQTLSPAKQSDNARHEVVA